MAYLLTFTIRIYQMQVNMPYMDPPGYVSHCLHRSRALQDLEKACTCGVFMKLPNSHPCSTPFPGQLHVLNCTRKVVPSTFVKRCAGYMASSPMQRTTFGGEKLKLYFSEGNT